MGLKPVTDSLDGIPESAQDFYTEQDGKYVLQLEGDPPGYVPADDLKEVKTTLSDFRDTNIGLKQKNDQLQEQLKSFEGVDPDEYQKLQSELNDLRKKAPKKDEQMQTLQSQLDELSKRLEESDKREQQTKRQLAVKDFESKLRDMGAKAGIDERAMPDYLSRARSVFEVGDDFEITTDQYSKRNPGKPLDPAEWVEGLQEEASHLFKPSSGGGANPKPGVGSTKTFDADDPNSWISNLEGIAKGEVVRQQ